MRKLIEKCNEASTANLLGTSDIPQACRRISFAKPAKCPRFEASLCQTMVSSILKNLFLVPVLIAGLGVMLAGRVTAQTFTTLHSFSKGGYVTNYFEGGTNSDGAIPTAALILSGTTLYGTAYAGGSGGNGALFAIQTDGTGFKVIHSFEPILKSSSFLTNNDGANPLGLLVLSGNTFFGTASAGGGSGNGTLFAAHTDGTSFTVLHSFSALNSGINSDGAYPHGGLVSPGNILYGTTYGGGSWTNGTVFKVNTDGTGFTTLYNFTGANDGAQPLAGLILSGNTLYGTASQGGSFHNGTVFAINTDGTGFTSLHVFRSDGANPQSELLLVGKTLYGTTPNSGPAGLGTVFKLNTDGTAFTNLYAFGSSSDGFRPTGGLVLFSNMLYGTTFIGGPADDGTVFRINTDGTSFTTLYSFTLQDPNTNTNSDGAYPQAALVASGNALFGTASSGGSADNGTVFSISFGPPPPPPQATNTPPTFTTLCTTLYDFTGGLDGDRPTAGLTLLGDILYGTTSGSGIGTSGTIFAIRTNGAGFSTLYSFTGTTWSGAPDYVYTNIDGAFPGSLIVSGNTLYGTASKGGPGGGTVFKIDIDATSFTVLHGFTAPSIPPPYTNSDGANPNAGLVLSGNTLYGTAVNGGSAGVGTVFKVDIDGTGFTTLHDFTARGTANGANSDGAYPQGGLVLSGSTLYGTAVNGGSQANGSVFAVNIDGTGFRNIHSFFFPSGSPVATLTLSSNTLYGTTTTGGTGGGTVFAINTNGTGFNTLYTFAYRDGSGPYAELIPNSSANTLYGTASQGGNSHGSGTAFAINTDGTDFTNLYSFTSLSGDNTNIDGIYPNGLILSGNTLYGTASAGGSFDQGTVFSISLLPTLTIVPFRPNVVLSWATNFAGFYFTDLILLSTTNLVSPVWTRVLTAPVIANGRYTVTNPISGTEQFFRLSH